MNKCHMLAHWSLYDDAVEYSQQAQDRSYCLSERNDAVLDNLHYLIYISDPGQVNPTSTLLIVFVSGSVIPEVEHIADLVYNCLQPKKR